VPPTAPDPTAVRRSSASQRVVGDGDPARDPGRSGLQKRPSTSPAAVAEGATVGGRGRTGCSRHRLATGAASTAVAAQAGRGGLDRADDVRGGATPRLAVCGLPDPHTGGR
jgi:hypothetical protein